MTIIATPTITYDIGFNALPELDTVLLYDLVRWAEMDEQDMRDGKFREWGEWNQGSWSWTDNTDLSETERREALNGACRTSYCIAGQAAYQGGYRLIYGEAAVGSADNCILQMAVGTDAQGHTRWVDDPEAVREPIWAVAQRVIGLTDEEQDALFSGDNGVGDLKQMANLFVHARNLPVLFPDEGMRQVDRGEGWDYWTTDNDAPF